MVQTDFDLLIVGAGMVGASLALALQSTGLNIGIVEAEDFAIDEQPSYDDRGIALSYGSQRIFETMGVWAQLHQSSTPIKSIHISDRGHFGVSRLSSESERIPALGQVVTAKILGRHLNTLLQQSTRLTVLSPLKVDAIKQDVDHVRITLNDQRQLTTRLLVAADGQHSTVRQLLGLSVWQRDYQQTAITANISTERPHLNQAFERFTESGPLALLPMTHNRCSLIWTVKTGEETDLLELNDAAFLQQLQQRFGYRLGKFTRIGHRRHYPLGLMQSEQAVQHRIVLIGNAAHSLHPIAGQGFNLGLRDVAVLAEVLADNALDCGHPRALQHYKEWQLPDQDKVVKATDLLVKTFSNANPILGHSRSAALAALECLPPLKSLLARNSMGLSGKQSRLTRGLPL